MRADEYNELQRFNTALSHELLAYVYVLRDPSKRGSPIFYVGKGVGKRALHHSKEAHDSKNQNKKLRTIRRIHELGLEPVIEIVRHRLTEEEAWKVEASLIDVIGPENLTNVVRGHGAEFGRATLASLNAKYGELPLAPTNGKPILIIRLKPTKIEKTSRERMEPGATRERAGWWPTITPDELYDSTRGWWKISKSIEDRGITHCVSVVNQVSRAVYRIDEWHTRRKDGRRAFVGVQVESGVMHSQYMGKRGKRFEFALGVQSPVLYWPSRQVG